MLVLYREETVVMRLPLGERPLELGRAPGCDLVLDDPELADRHWLVMRQRGTVVAYDVSKHARRLHSQHVPLGQRFAVGRHHALVRDEERGREHELPRSSALVRDTEALLHHVERVENAKLYIVVGQGSAARALRVGDEPLHIGRGPGNDLELSDRAVSARQCRLEPCGDGLVLRDLGSANGTLVNGVRIASALVRGGAHIRVGRTDLHLVGREIGRAGEAPVMIATAPAMLSAIVQAEQAARFDWPALILGESGTGKEGIARLLHERGPRRARPYVALNSGGVPGELIESELFGHERGAFTGANGVRRGVFEQADGGTLFLDEIGELPMALQARLLRVLESGDVRRLGAESARRVNVRLVCATHRDLRAMAADGRFRADLYFRIARSVIELPALRARLEDVAPIAEHVLRGLAPMLGSKALSVEAADRLRGYSWPGNVRELRNVVSAAAASTLGAAIERSDVECALARLGAQDVPVSDETLVDALQHHNGNLSAAARALGVPRTTLRDRLRKRA
jgi:transcriptional regulator with AAA-type ATPase domain/pSer/pThr/pTyr-binding forkhead associated (FHA) protein